MRFGGLSDKRLTDWAVFSVTQRAVELLQQFSGLFYALTIGPYTIPVPALLNLHGVYFPLVRSTAFPVTVSRRYFPGEYHLW